MGRLIILEGGEGAGKSTMARRLAAHLSASGRTVLTTREPGGTPFAEQLRTLLFSIDSEQVSAAAAIYLLWAARIDHVERRIMPALRDGDVIVDRFAPSTLAYQVAAIGRIDLIRLFVALYTDLERKLDPLYLFLDVEPALGLERRRAEGTTLTTFDQKDLSYHEAVRLGYLEFGRLFPRGWRRIDASAPEDEVFASILAALAPKGS